MSFNSGDARISFVDVRDIAAADAEMLLTPGAHHFKEYTLTGLKALTLKETAGLISKAAGRTITYVAVDDAAFEKALKGYGMSEWDIKAMASLGPHAREGLRSTVSDDVRILTRKNPIHFEKFADEYAHIWQKVPAAV